jgi:NADH:ubiquinone reductase (H+-translocating)
MTATGLPTSERCRGIAFERCPWKGEGATALNQLVGRLFVLDTSGGRVFSMNPEGSDLRTLVTAGRIPNGISVDPVASRPRVVIVGCGFGGLSCAKALKHSAVETIVVDRNNYHLFQPLLYQVATAALSPADIAQPIRSILRDQKNSLVMLGDVQRVGLEEKCIYVNDEKMAYDYLVLAPGAVDNYFGHTDWARAAPGMKMVEDATRIRSRMLLSFERAEFEKDPAKRSAHLSFVIVGGGPTGVELAGAVRELAGEVIPRDFRLTDTRRARVILIEAGSRLLPTFDPLLSEKALRQLVELGVEVRLGAPVTAIRDDGVEVAGEELRSYNVIWAAGVRAAPVVQSLVAELGPGGRVKVRADCSIPGHAEVFVIGDAAYLVDSDTDRQVPGVSQGALQMGHYVAKVIQEDLKGRWWPRAMGFHYRDLGSMATIGRFRAIVQIGRFRLTGLLAWMAWLTLHLTVLIGFRSRFSVLMSWVYSYVFVRRGSRLITRYGPEPDAASVEQHQSAAQPP